MIDGPRIERGQELETPQAIVERQQSRYAYTDLTPGQTEALLRESFALQLRRIDADPSRALADVAIENAVSPTEAIVETEGERSLLESTVPIRVPAKDGKLAKVDLALERIEGGGFAPKNSLADVSLPADVSGAIEVGDVTLRLVASGEKDAAPAEVSAARTFSDEDLVLPDVAEDTSLLLSPVTGGLELSTLIASRRSPEQLSFAVTMPADVRLLPAADGGAEVVPVDEKGEPLARIGVPFAIDAQGTRVPVSLVVKENSISLDVAHRSMDIAYPLFIDPEIEENWSGFADTSKLNYWNWQYSGVGPEDYIGWRGPIVTNWGNGLYVRSRSNFSYPGGSFGRWWFVPQGSTTYLRRVIFGPMHMDGHGCWANEPHGYVGVWNNGGFWSVHAPATPSAVTTWVDTGEQNLGAGARTAFVGLHADGTVKLTCGRDYAMNGAVLYLSDPEDPSVSAIYPPGWVKDNSPFTLSVPVYDPGLGVKSATVSPQDAPPLPTQALSCTGHYDNPCPASYTFPFTVSADSFDQGEKEVQVSAKDAMGKTSNTFPFTLKVDRTPPDVTLSGQLATATKEAEGETKDPTDFDPLSLSVYNLTIKAEDGVENGSAAQRRSGVKSIEVFLDEEKMPLETWAQPSCSNSCGMVQTFALKLNELTALAHHALRVVVKDHAGNTPRERKIEFEYVPATGMKEEYVLQHFPLPNGQGEEDSEEDPIRPELAVNLMNGNLVYRQLDVEVPGPAADLEVERFYNSLLPESQDTEWGDGWTLAQTPTLETEGSKGSPGEATLVEESGAVESQVELPEEIGEKKFDPELQAVIAKSGSGYEVTDEGGGPEGTLVFNESGEAAELEAGEYAGVDYAYQEGTLSEIVVDDRAATDLLPGEVEEPLRPIQPPTYAKSFAPAGQGNGQLSAPWDLATDSEGNVWVVDAVKNCVQRFNSEGKYLSQFGSYGSASGQLSAPSAIAIDPEGDVWVLDLGNSRIEEFSPSGQFIQKIDFQAEEIEEEMVSPLTDLAIDPEGNVWALEGSHDRVKKFSAEGEYLSQFGSGGTGNGQFTWPSKIQADSDGHIWVFDQPSHRLQKFSTEGEYLSQIGFAKGWVAAIATDPEGHLWVLDSTNSRAEALAPDGSSLAQFGSYGAGAGQFYYPTGLAIDEQGNFWVLTYNNSQKMQKWSPPNYSDALYASAVAGEGEQLQSPADVDVDAEGNLWVPDSAGDRIEKFDSRGELLDEFGSSGSANGQLDSPSAVAIDAEGNLWVADQGNNRIQKFNDQGEYLAEAGSEGSGDAQFGAGGPADVALDPQGNIWVADPVNHRIQKFGPEGQFLEAWNEGQIAIEEEPLEPTSLDVGPNGSVWIADGRGGRIVGFTKDNWYLREIYSGLEDQGVEVDRRGDIWVADSGKDRVRLFDQGGAHVLDLGEAGSGEAELSAPAGLASDGYGGVWVADTGNHRLQKWVAGTYVASEGEEAPEPNDPAVQVQSDDGLVESVEGEEAGEISYEHDDELLTSVENSEGETSYEYDENDRMTKVTLPNGTYAEIAYEATYGRVESVTVAIEATNAKTTYFDYEDQPQRRTTVTRPAPDLATTYEFAADGSMLKWANAKEPPTIDDVGGTLHDNRETASPIAPGLYNLSVQASSAHGISSIQIIANNNILQSEKTCSQIPGPPVECEKEKDEWVLETGNFAPGILYLEVVATNALGESSSERFWVNIPYAPPLEPESDEPPKFADILKFREEFGLDLDLKGDEETINDRIFSLIGAWSNPHTMSGEVARATMERWGIPLRGVDAAELEFRERYIAYDGPEITKWGEENAASTFAGYYVDHRAGGILYVGFTQNQASQVAALRQGLAAPGRVKEFPNAPSYSLSHLKSIEAAVNGTTSISSSISGIWVEIATNRLGINATNQSLVSEKLTPGFGAAVAIYPSAPPPPLPARFSRFNGSGPVQAGDNIHAVSGEFEFSCSAGFGAWDELPKKKPNEQPTWVPFMLTAGHCFPKGTVVRQGDPGDLGVIGEVKRSNWIETGAMTLDAEAVRTIFGKEPRAIYLSPNRQKQVKQYVTPLPGTIICQSGVKTNTVVCGPVLDGPRDTRSLASDGVTTIHTIAIPIGNRVSRGDSGGPAWVGGTGEAVGLITAAGSKEFGYGSCLNFAGAKYNPLVDSNYVCPITGITPIQEIISGSASLYNAETLTNAGLAAVPSLPVRGITRNGG